MPQKALVVDNDFFFVEFLSELLEARGYRVIKAYDGKEGMEKLEQDRVDILFVDMVMPKVDGQQLIGFARMKFPDRAFPIVAVSATIIEHLGDLDRIAADYYIAKGPMENMADQFNNLMDRITNRPFPANGEDNVFESGKLYPRIEALELIDSVRFQRALVNSIGVGIVVVDRDAKVMSANETAFEILGRTPVETLNRPVPGVFPAEARGDLVKALKAVARSPDLRRAGFAVETAAGVLRVVVSLFRLEEEHAGWIVAVEDVDQWAVPA